MKYTELLVHTTAYNPKTEEYIEIQDSILKQNFRMTISMQQEETTQVAMEVGPIFGFHTANALDCGPPIVYEDLISQINIIMIDPNNELSNKTVSTLFGYQKPSSTEITTIKEYLDAQTKFEPRDYFRLSCTEPDKLYNQAQFMVEVILESGKALTENTDLILFKD